MKKFDNKLDTWIKPKINTYFSAGLNNQPGQCFVFSSCASARVDIYVLATPMSTKVAENNNQSQANY